jgi:hypothetical protein
VAVAVAGGGCCGDGLVGWRHEETMERDELEERKRPVLLYPSYNATSNQGSRRRVKEGFASNTISL